VSDRSGHRSGLKRHGILSGLHQKSHRAQATATPETFAERFRGVPATRSTGFNLRWFLDGARPAQALRVAGRLVFVNSMSNLFHEDVRLRTSLACST